MVKKYKTKDSGKRQIYDSGMNRDLQDGKPQFDLIIPKNQKYGDSLLYRWAMLMERGRAKYGKRNWENANSQEEMERFKSSAFRHFMQWFHNEDDEDHAAAVLFNINAHEYVKEKIKDE
ncbi:MAG: dATP/dGTP diphosphohydrolase domain-containing protein [Promethearchaeota archaeon]